MDLDDGAPTQCGEEVTFTIQAFGGEGVKARVAESDGISRTRLRLQFPDTTVMATGKPVHEVKGLLYNCLVAFGQNQLQFEVGGWRVEIDRARREIQHKPGLSSPWYRPTHCLRAKRIGKDGQGPEGVEKDADRRLQCLSFVSGQYVSIGLATGLDDQGEGILQHWGKGYPDAWIEPHKRLRLWFLPAHKVEIENFIPLLWKKLVEAPQAPKPLLPGIRNWLDANHPEQSAQSSVQLTKAGLEKLIGKIEVLRQALVAMNVSLSIPVQLPALQNANGNRPLFKDGPDALYRCLVQSEERLRTLNKGTHRGPGVGGLAAWPVVPRTEHSP